MEAHLASALGAVKMAVGDAAQKADKRRLHMYREKIPCKAGCNGCCSRLLMISVAEALLMYEELKRTGEWEDVREHARSQFKPSQEISPVAWFKMNVKCPVLSRRDGTCRAYSVRPGLCSTHFVTSDPDLCDPWSAKAGPYEPVDMQDVYVDFQKRLEAGMAGNGIMSVVAPVPAALLIAEKVQEKTSLDLSQVVSILYSEFK